MKNFIPSILLFLLLFCVYFLYSYLQSVENTIIPTSDESKTSIPINEPTDNKPTEPASFRQGKG